MGVVSGVREGKIITEGESKSDLGSERVWHLCPKGTRGGGNLVAGGEWGIDQRALARTGRMRGRPPGVCDGC